MVDTAVLKVTEVDRLPARDLAKAIQGRDAIIGFTNWSSPFGFPILGVEFVLGQDAGDVWRTKKDGCVPTVIIIREIICEALQRNTGVLVQKVSEEGVEPRRYLIVLTGTIGTSEEKWRIRSALAQMLNM